MQSRALYCQGAYMLLVGILLKIQACKRFQKNLEDNQGQKYDTRYDMIYLTAIRQPPGGNSLVRIYTQTIQGTSQNKQYIEQHKNIQSNIKKHRTNKNQEECGPCPIFAGFTLAFALQLRKKHGKTSVTVDTILVMEHERTERMWPTHCQLTL